MGLAALVAGVSLMVAGLAMENDHHVVEVVPMTVRARQFEPAQLRGEHGRFSVWASADGHLFAKKSFETPDYGGLRIGDRVLVRHEKTGLSGRDLYAF
jgi:hypothetical protein